MVHHRGARRRGGAGQHHRQAGVVELAVVVDNGALERLAIALAVGAERGEAGQRLQQQRVRSKKRRGSS